MEPHIEAAECEAAGATRYAESCGVSAVSEGGGAEVGAHGGQECEGDDDGGAEWGVGVCEVGREVFEVFDGEDGVVCGGFEACSGGLRGHVESLRFALSAYRGM